MISLLTAFEFHGYLSRCDSTWRHTGVVTADCHGLSVSDCGWATIVCREQLVINIIILGCSICDTEGHSSDRGNLELIIGCITILCI